MRAVLLFGMRAAPLFGVLSLVWLPSAIVHAGAGTDLGVIGQTYAIAEPSMLESIHAKLETAAENGELAKIEADMKQRFIAYAHRPKGVTLPRTQAHKVRYFDPTVRFTQGIKDHDGNVLWPAGTTVNPLDYIALSQEWIFFNADDPDQAAWAQAYVQRHPEEVRLILTQGPVLKLMQTWGVRLYFDQGGKLVERFGLERLPAVISQEGKRLRIDEVVPEDEHG
jgi:conjugal transfer pilus assembly protein TraW